MVTGRGVVSSTASTWLVCTGINNGLSASNKGKMTKVRLFRRFSFAHFSISFAHLDSFICALFCISFVHFFTPYQNNN